MGARVIIFSGQVDALVSTNGADYMINQLKFFSFSLINI